MRYVDPDGNEIIAIATITSIEKTKLGFTANGSIEFTDNKSNSQLKWISFLEEYHMEILHL